MTGERQPHDSEGVASLCKPALASLAPIYKYYNQAPWLPSLPQADLRLCAHRAKQAGNIFLISITSLNDERLWFCVVSWALDSTWLVVPPL
jgi:hypothetical protein